MKARVFAASAVMTCVLAGIASAYPQPEPQALKLNTSVVSPPSGSFGIYVDSSSPGTFLFIAERAAAWLGVTAPIRDLSELGDFPNESQIVVGNPAVSAAIEDLAALHGVSTLDVGTEGYEVDSRMDPAAGHVWRVLIVTTTVSGARNAVATLRSEQGANGSFKQMRVRDYPDRSHRGFLYSTRTVGLLTHANGEDYYDVPAWLTARKADIDDMAMRGINTIYFQTFDFFHLEDVATGDNGAIKLGDRFKELFDYCRNIGVEPAASMGPLNDGGGPFANADHAVYREGIQITDEVFGFDGQYLTNNNVFDNTGQNLDWSVSSAGVLPQQWETKLYPSGSPGSWTWDEPTRKLKVSTSTPENEVRTTVPIVPGSYYVLRVKFTRIDFVAPEGGGYFRPWILVRADPNYRMYFPLSDTQPGVDNFYPNGIVYECPFLVPDDYIDPSPGNGQNEVEIIITSRSSTNVNLEVSEVHLERRNASLRNLMRDGAALFQGTAFPGLPVFVKAMNGTPYTENVDYVVEDHPLSWEMSSTGPVSRIRWLGTPPAAGSVKVTCTLGVPSANVGRSWANTTWCFNNANLYRDFLEAFQRIFGGSGSGFHLNPKYIHLSMDEQRGVNRCGRCVQKGLSNQEYFTSYLNRVQGILEQQSGAAQSHIVVYADMLNPYQNGEKEDYQYANWMGKWGSSRLENTQMGLLDSDIILHLWHPTITATTVAADWPAQHAFIAGPESNSNPEQWATIGDLYDDPACQGYAVLQWARYALPTTSDDRMFDYAWKRYKHPDASVHAFVGSEFVTDEVGGHLVSIQKSATLTVRPYGRKVRVPGCTATVSGSINWGEGSATSVSSTQLNSASFNKIYSTLGLKTLTLTVNATGCTTSGCTCGGNASSTATLNVEVVPKNTGCEPDCPDPEGVIGTLPETEAPEQDFTAAIRAIRPNPFAANVAIHFTVPVKTRPEMEVFDIGGRRVKHAVLGEHAPGAWQWTWNGTNESGNAVGAGVYFVRARLGSTVQTRRLVKLDQ